ncbi:MAG: hypothetical protein KF834_12265 [Burkholderiales bacterium]|nr:hypothetical protein [Burkholderiales bacterium]
MSPAVTTGEPTPPTGRRQALRDLRRELTNEDLASPGVQKLLLDELGRADADCEILNGYVTRFHDADKRAAVLDEKLRTQTALEIAFGVGIGVGGAIMGLAPSFWDKQPLGYLTLTVGFLLMIGAIIARVIKR